MMRFRSRLVRLITGVGVALALFALPTAVQADATTGTLFFTSFAGGANVHKTTYTYDGAATFGIGGISTIAFTPGADGIIFTTDGHLAVGGQGNAVHKVDPNAFNSFTTVTAGGTSAFHVMMSPAGVIFSAGIPGMLASYPGTLTANGVPFPVTYASGGATPITHVAWDSGGNAFYTGGGPGGFGEFGSLDFGTSTATPILGGVPAAHGMAFDSFSGKLVLFGDGHITQIDPGTGMIVSDLDLSSSGFAFDQGSVDGNGHIFAASNTGHLVFLDITSTGLVASFDFMAVQFLVSALDDIAPLSGGGAQPIPEPGTLTLAGFGLLGLLGYGYHRRKRQA